jgi:hypothetical protein
MLVISKMNAKRSALFGNVSILETARTILYSCKRFSGSNYNKIRLYIAQYIINVSRDM